MNFESMDVPIDFRIHSPRQFERLLLLLSRLLDAGVLKQCDLADKSQGSIDLRRLQPGGPWPDILEAEFVSSDGRRYHLFVDTFHGAGGQWRALD